MPNTQGVLGEISAFGQSYVSSMDGDGPSASSKFVNAARADNDLNTLYVRCRETPENLCSRGVSSGRVSACSLTGAPNVKSGKLLPDQVFCLGLDRLSGLLGDDRFLNR